MARVYARMGAMHKLRALIKVKTCAVAGERWQILSASLTSAGAATAAAGAAGAQANPPLAKALSSFCSSLLHLVEGPATLWADAVADHSANESYGRGVSDVAFLREFLVSSRPDQCMKHPPTQYPP